MTIGLVPQSGSIAITTKVLPSDMCISSHRKSIQVTFFCGCTHTSVIPTVRIMSSLGGTVSNFYVTDLNGDEK